MEASAPWWEADLRTDSGYDVVAINTAQLSHGSEGGEAMTDEERDQLKARLLRARTAREESRAQSEAIKAWREEAKRSAEQRDILPAEVYSQFVREVLGMWRKKLEALPPELGRRATPEQRPLVYVPPNKIKKPKDASPLQRFIEKMLEEFEQWLNTDPQSEAAE